MERNKKKELDALRKRAGIPSYTPKQCRLEREARQQTSDIGRLRTHLDARGFLHSLDDPTAFVPGIDDLLGDIPNRFDFDDEF